MELRKMQSYEEAVAYLSDAPRFTSGYEIERTTAIWRRLGEPGRSCAVVHVAGTNGKGSVCACLRSLFLAAGKKVCMFTSPHLTDIRERFVCGNEWIVEQELLACLNRVLEVLSEEEDYTPNFSELLFYVYQVYLERSGAEISILETGMGGRLDPTNALPDKALAVLTRIGLDHMAYLGDTIGQIAAEKAGILRPGRPVVYSDLVPEASEVIRAKAERLGCREYPVSDRSFSDVVKGQKNIDFSLHTRYYGTKRLSVPVSALYQVENVSLAVTAAEVLLPEGELTDRVLQSGLSAFTWEARMEEIFPGVFLDGAHNIDGIRAFLETVRADGCKGKRLLLAGMLADKAYPEMLRTLAGSGLFAGVRLTGLRCARSATGAQLSEVLNDFSWPGMGVQVTEDPWEALCAMRAEAAPEDRIYVAGSLYLAGEIKEHMRHDQL